MKKIFIIILFLPFLLGPVFGEGYKLPPKEIVDILDATPPPSVSLSPGGRYLLLAESPSMPTLQDMARPQLKLAGLRFSPLTRSRFPERTITELTLLDIQSKHERVIPLPVGTRCASYSWSFDGRAVAFAEYGEKGLELWVVETADPKPRRLGNFQLNAIFGRGYEWLPDNRSLLVFTVPEGQGEPPQAPAIPDSPRLQETSGKVSRVATYQDLLKNTFDEALFAYYAASQLRIVDLSGRDRPLGAVSMIIDASASPDGRSFLVTELKQPFSYTVPFYNFPSVIEIWDNKGQVERLIADQPLADQIPMNGVRTGPRSAQWHPTAAVATLVWVEALDGGNPEKNAPFRDRILQLSSPFSGEPRELAKTAKRFTGIEWLERSGNALVSDFDWKTEKRSVTRIDTGNAGKKAKMVFSYNVNDSYGLPGNPVTRTLRNGMEVVREVNGQIFLSGRGASPEGDRPFLDRYNPETAKKKRLFQCAKEKYQEFFDFTDENLKEILVRSESKREPPNYYSLRLGSSALRPVTFYKDPAPQLTGVEKKLITYKRADGVLLSGILYLPPGYEPGKRLPLVLWAYPREYTDARTAGQVRGSEHRFTFFRGPSQLFYLTRGYAVLDSAQMPVVGDPKTKNNTFVQQIVDSARAAIDTLDRMEIIDPKRVGVGGHSYGAFMTANLLVQCDLFAAGVARSGAYNRSLTPFGFQNERRSFWEAPDVYMYVSPFSHADKIKAPILLIHGQEDNNTGTFPIQSERFYAALKGFGATARLVMLPLESHGYQARESVLHTLAEMIEWFDRFVKKSK